MSDQATVVPQDSPAPAAIDFAANETAFADYIKSKGFEITKQADVQKSIDEAIRKAHESWETKLATSLGKQKPEGIKGLDWAASEIETLKKPATVDNPTDKAIEDSAVKSLTEKVQALEKQIADKEKANLELEINTHIREGIASQKLAVPSHLKGEEAEKFQATQRAALEYQIKSGFRTEKDSQGRVVFFEGDTPLIDPATQAPLKAEQIVRSRFGYMLEAPKPTTTGTGQHPNGTPAAGYMGSTKQAIYDKAAEMGLVTGSKEWMTAVNEAKAAAGIK